MFTSCTSQTKCEVSLVPVNLRVQSVELSAQYDVLFICSDGLLGFVSICPWRLDVTHSKSYSGRESSVCTVAEGEMARGMSYRRSQNDVMSSKGTVGKPNVLLEVRCFQMEGERLFEACDASRSTSVATLDTNFRPNKERPAVLLILVTRALSGAGIVFPDKSYVPLGVLRFWYKLQ